MFVIKFKQWLIIQSEAIFSFTNNKNIQNRQYMKKKYFFKRIIKYKVCFLKTECQENLEPFAVVQNMKGLRDNTMNC